MSLRKSIFQFIILICFKVNAQTKIDTSFVNPTGTYSLVNKVIKRNGETYGYTGDVVVKLLPNSKIAINFFVCKGAPGYNSGSFEDTLYYIKNKAIYTTRSDSSCKVIFTFSGKGVKVIEEADDYNSGCGFGHGIVADGFYRKISSKIPDMKAPY